MNLWKNMDPMSKSFFKIVGCALFVMWLPVLIARYNREPNPPTALETIPVAEDWDDLWQDNLEVVCIEGHAYYFANRGDWGAILAPKLQDDGKPVKCGPIVEKS